MPPVSFIVMESFVYVLAVLLSRHAYKRGTRWLSTYLWSMAFGLTIELLLVVKSDPLQQHYRYGEFLLMASWGEARVPVWVGVGWGVVVYLSTFTAQRLRSPWWTRPFSAGVLAVNLDLSLDPIAHHLGYWTWFNADPLNFYGVPYDNFLGWFLIVSSFALCARAGFHFIPKGAFARVYWIPPLAGVVALGLAYVVGLLVEGVYSRIGDFAVFCLVFAVAGPLTLSFTLKSRRDNPKEPYVLGSALAIHGLLLLLLFATESYQSHPSLAVCMPLAILVGFFAFAWCSIDSWFPQGPRVS